MNIIILLIAIVGGAAGALSTLCCIVMIPVTIIWKIYRKIRYGISIFD